LKIEDCKLKIGGCRFSPSFLINPAIYYVIPRKGHREIQHKAQHYWIPAFAGMTG